MIRPEHVLMYVSACAAEGCRRGTLVHQKNGVRTDNYFYVYSTCSLG